MKKSASFHEHLLHWLWQNRYLSSDHLLTTSGEKVMIHHPGYHNKTDGPDFTHARISIGDLKWLGDVEIHWHLDDWSKHHHQNDPNFNQVILHVVFDPTNKSDVLRHDQTTIPTLCIQPHLTRPLQYFFHHYQQAGGLPCAGNLAKIPEKIIKQQFEEAHRLYFEQKVNDFLLFYDANLPVSEAWKQALVIALFDCLGVSHNREPMKKLACRLLKEDTADFRVKTLIKYALKTAGIEPEKPGSGFSWARKGSRPANHPENRIKQGCCMMHFIYQKEFGWWLKKVIEDAFSQMIRYIDTRSGIGKQQSNVLFGAVWIPAFYLLGKLMGAERLTSGAANKWSDHRTALPTSISRRFLRSGMPAAAFQNKLGAVHQYRAFCKPKQCQDCKIFQHIISS
jgi:hypothetical protein